MKLLEVVRIPQTSDETHSIVMEFGKLLGKTCITCKDTPGFVVNRLLAPYISEAVRMLEVSSRILLIESPFYLFNYFSVAMPQLVTLT